VSPAAAGEGQFHGTMPVPGGSLRFDPYATGKHLRGVVDSHDAGPSANID
jgi:hypothetical protein